ncbi:transporter [Flavobacterium coralii]|uniref:transporter n=1 Tax=Flavobacterium coralii TaxID=2838017 RepID=UPI000C507727|nr:hypothetical protein [Flavobacterium sp.]|tara:strand:- start:7921 stop:8856 length:936 start_codon:yes stop_codon:yes gene_type:complete
MKKYIIIVLIAVQPLFAFAPPPDFKQYLSLLDDCDACGCSASGGGMGFSSMINQNFAGVRYFYQSYSSRDGVFNDSPCIDENFNTVQLWARIPLSEKIQVTALLPYHFHNRELSTGTQQLSGAGDVTVLGFYKLYQTQKDSAVFNHMLQAGAGIKAPTGKYDSTNNGSVNPSFQLGTGSWDYLLAAEYIITHKKMGLNTMVNYTIKTKNDKEYRFGNQWNYAATLFYLIEKPQFTVVPQTGIAGEIYDANKQYGEELPDTEGRALFGKLGVEARYDKFSVGLNAMLPLSQNLTGGKVEANYRWSVNINYSL